MLRSPRIITDNVGKVIARKDFNAFGDETASAQRTDTLGYKPEEVRQDYTGYQKDDESGLEFAQARYYNNKHGRFTSVDPLTASANVKDPQTFNRYSYAMNSPYKFTDPLGLVSKPRQSSLVDAGAIASDARNAPAAGTDPIVTGGRANSTPASAQAAEPPTPTAEQNAAGSADGVSPVVANYEWFIEDTRSGKVNISENANNLLNKATSDMATNVANAIIAVSAVEDFPKTSTAVKSETTAGASSSGITFTATNGTVTTVKSSDEVYAALTVANNTIRSNLVESLKTEVVNIKLAKDERFENHKLQDIPTNSGLNMAQAFAADARATANQLGKERIISTLPEKRIPEGFRFTNF